MKLKLYHYWRSSCSWRVRWVFDHKQIPYELESINLLDASQKTDAYRQLNPMAQVPALEFVPEPGESAPVIRYLGESLGIVEWAEEKYPEPAVIPGDAMQRARIRQLVHIIASGTQPIQNIGVQFHHSDDPKIRAAWARHWIEKGLDAYETLVKKTAGKFSIGDTFTLADVCLIPQCYNAKRFGLDFEKRFPGIARIYDETVQLKSYQSSEPGIHQPA